MNHLDHLKSKVMRLAVSPSGFSFDPQTGQSFTLNPTGLEALQLLRQDRSLPEIAETMAQDYQQSLERVEVELDSFWKALSRQMGFRVS